MDGLLHENLDIAKSKVVERDVDLCVLIDGKSGIGKSTIAVQMAYFLDPTFCLERVCFDAETFKQSLMKAKRGQSIILDEAFQTLNVRQTLSEMNRVIIGLMQEIRQRNLYVFIVLPSFFDLEKNVVLWRSHMLLHVYGKEFGDRGRFMVFSDERKNLLYIMGKKFYSYSRPKANFIGKFTKAFPLNWHAYRKKKAKALEKRLEEKVKKRNRFKEERDILLKHLKKEFDINSKKLSDLIGLSVSEINFILRG